MRTRLAVFLALVVGIAASVAIAAPDKVTSPFVDEATTLGTVEGSATLDPKPQGGEVMLHAKLSGLDANTSYELVILTEAVGCGAGEVLETITFVSLQNGTILLNRKVAEDISNIGSVAIRFPGVDPTLVACADF
jgi:hypothetical protein